MAKIAFISDLHLETQEAPNLDAPRADAAVFVGDILAPRHDDKQDSAVRRIERICQGWDMPVFLIPGNHEFEGRLIDRELDRLRLHSQDSFVQVMYNDSAVVGAGDNAVLLLGTTLWTNFELYGKDSQEDSYNHCARRFGDFNYRREDGSFLELDEVVSEFSAAMSWLSIESQQSDLPIVVASHFAPHRNSVAKKWEGDESSAWFVNDLHNEVVEKVAAWIHGHTHSPVRYRVGRRPGFGHVLGNPYGFHETIVLDDLNEIARQMILDRYPEIEITGKITLSEVPSFKGMEIVEVSSEGVVS